MFPRMLCRKQWLFLLIFLTIFLGAYFLLPNENLSKTRKDNLILEKEIINQDKSIKQHPKIRKISKKSIKADETELVANHEENKEDEEESKDLIGPAIKPYTMPTDFDYETMKEVMPHMWRNAIKDILPHSCDFITFDYNPDMDLGESMFIYASLYGVARKTNRIPFIDHKLGFPLSNIFLFKSMPTAGLSIDGSYIKNRETRGCCRFDSSILNISCNGKIILSGLRQNYEYFHSHKLELLSSEFIFQKKVQQSCVKNFNQILSKNNLSKSHCQLIGVHIRSSTRFNSRQKEKGHLGADPDYLQRAFDYFRQKFSKNSCLLFIVAGISASENSILPTLDDKNSSSKSIQKIILLENQSESEQLCMLTLCKHTIFTTGPTGWWAAYLTQGRKGGDVVYQLNYAQPNSVLMKELDSESYFLKSWIGK